MRARGDMIWIEPSKIISNWLPRNYSPEFLRLDEFLHSGVFFKLGEQFEPYVIAKEEANFNCKWLVSQLKNKIDIVAYRGIKNKRILNLPNSALIIGKWFYENLSVMYWNQSIFGKGCCLSDDTFVLIPKNDNQFSWIAGELEKNYVQLQIQRLVNTNYVAMPYGRINIDILLNINIKNYNNIEKLSSSVEEESKKLASNLNEKITIESAADEIKPTFLTGASFEERLTQFEEYILQQPFISRNKSFFIELSISNNSGLLYTTRLLRGVSFPVNDLENVKFQQDKHSEINWKNWLFDNKNKKYSIFNIKNANEGLPPVINSNLIKYIINDKIIFKNCTIPSFATYNDLIKLLSEQKIKSYLDSEVISDELLKLVENDTDLRYLQKIYSPVLAIKIARDNVIVGVYLLYIDIDNEDESIVKASLHGYGSELSKLSKQISEFVSDAARRESLRRLSVVMHRLNGPTGRALNGIQDLAEFIDNNPDLGNRLIPDEDTAKKRASMCNEPHERHNLASRINDIHLAINDIKKISYQVRRLRLAQSDLDKSPYDALSIIQLSLHSIDRIIPGLMVEFGQCDSCLININKDVIIGSFEEILSNACREMKEHSISNPKISISINNIGGFVKIIISDNGFPSNYKLITNPFDEDASSYARTGRGSGLGLAIVKETIIRHGGNCFLYENTTDDGNRLPGVTFEASLPEYHP